MNLYGWRVPLVGMGGKAYPLGYVVIRVQVERVPEYDEDQVAFGNDNTTFSWWVPVVLGTPTINRIVAVMKESNLHNAPMEWQASRTSYELVNGFLMWRLHLEPEGGFPTNTGENPVDLDETISLTSKCVALPFESVIVHSRTQQTMMMDHQLNVMTQAPYPDDMVSLPNGIYITWAYTDMKPGSHQVSVIIRNMTSRPIHLPRGKVVTCVVASNAVLNAKPSPDLLKKTGDGCTNQASSEHGGKTQAAHCCPREGWRTRMTEDVAAQAGCQGDQTVIGIPGHLLSGTSWNRMHGHHGTWHWAAGSWAIQGKILPHHPATGGGSEAAHSRNAGRRSHPSLSITLV